MASPSAIFGPHSTLSLPTKLVQLAVRVPGGRVQRNKQCVAYLAQLPGGTMLPRGNITDGRRRHSTSQERLLRTRTKEKERGREEGQLQVRPKQHDAVAAPRRQLTKRVVSSAGPAALVVLLLAIVSIPDRVASFLARACSCRERKRDGAQ